MITRPFRGPMSFEHLSQMADVNESLRKQAKARKKAVRTVNPPKEGYRLRWGREEPGGDEDFCAAWTKGHKQPALTLLILLSNHRKELEEAGVDFKTLRVEGLSKSSPA